MDIMKFEKKDNKYILKLENEEVEYELLKETDRYILLTGGLSFVIILIDKIEKKFSSNLITVHELPVPTTYGKVVIVE